MAKISYILKGKNDPVHIYLRFSNGRKMDLMTGTDIYINKEYWDNKNQKIRNVIAVPSRDSLNSKLDKLKIEVIDRYNMDYSDGIITDNQWLKSVVKNFFKRPKGEELKRNIDHKIYFTDFNKWWLENEADKWKVKAEKYLDEAGKYYYEVTNDLFIEFQGKTKFKASEIDSNVLGSFIDYLVATKKYNGGTADLYKTKIKFFCNRAVENGLPINPNYKSRIFNRKKDEGFKEPYLNEVEINHIFRYDFSYDDQLDNIRDSLIIGLCTGLRVSDFNNNLKSSDIIDDMIEIKTQKTGKWVAIPLHPMVKTVLNKRNGDLPITLDDRTFNRKIKEICRIAGIQNEMKGSLFDKDTKRKKVGVYPKYKLVTSHICRRSFATNNHNIVDNKILMDIGGWETESVFLHYIKKSNREQGQELSLAWNKKYSNI